MESYHAVSQVQKRCRNKSLLVVVADREADIHEVFAEQYNTPDGAQLLIRAERSRNRKVVDDKESCEFCGLNWNSNRRCLLRYAHLC
ncbi:MAG: hypothetical protein HS127_11395 [Planctomycetia bacterium]|nr:hypothetical protein [Planctomycetia bacterium]